MYVRLYVWLICPISSKERERERATLRRDSRSRRGEILRTYVCSSSQRLPSKARGGTMLLPYEDHLFPMPDTLLRVFVQMRRGKLGKAYKQLPAVNDRMLISLTRRLRVNTMAFLTQ